MKLHEIKAKLLTLPTIMDISDEIMIVNDIMSAEPADLVENCDILKMILEDLDLSHTDGGYVCLTSENEGIFIDFSHWLRKMNSELNLGILEVIIDEFNMTAERFDKLMKQGIKAEAERLKQQAEKEDKLKIRKRKNKKQGGAG